MHPNKSQQSKKNRRTNAFVTYKLRGLLTKPSLLTTFIIGLIILWMMPWKQPVQVIIWDTFGYYLYLPELFIYHDPGISDMNIIHRIFDQYNPSETFYQAHSVANGNTILQYPMGMAIMFLPAFLIAHDAAILFGFPADGFSATYQWAMVFEHFFVVLLGVFLFRKLLLHFFSEWITTLLLILIVFGSNYYSLCCYSIGSPHIYLFTLFCILLLQTIKWHEQPKVITGIWLGAILGLMAITRATDVLAILIPLLWNVTSVKQLKSKLYALVTTHRVPFLFLVGSFSIVVFIQLLFWKLYAGEFLHYSYPNAGEGFEFLSPYTFKFLFSFRKGWFIYTPLMLFTCMGFYFVKKYNRPLFLVLLVFTLINIYLLSSWSSWTYAASFGQRSLVQSYPLLAIALGYFVYHIQKMNIVYKYITGTFLVLCIVLNLFQTWQMQMWIIDPYRTTTAYYFAVFGKTHRPANAEDLLLVKRNFSPGQRFSDSAHYRVHYSALFDFENPNRDITRHVFASSALGSNHVLRINDSTPFSEPIRISFNELADHTDHAWVRVKMNYFFTGEASEIKPTLVTAFLNRRNESYDYHSYNLEEEKSPNHQGEWNTLQFDYLTPEVRNENDTFIVYFWLRGHGAFFVDNVEIRSFIKKEE